ncbi:hypothetical protein GCM10010149_68710 [Nonomuraea roseoviolacea subsp. roseoviolacea]|uniref:hypothetical protein n=1 Tax=Nonomuraea roseoviolacea TaxID=103837 RepID=UPI0031E178A9
MWAQPPQDGRIVVGLLLQLDDRIVIAGHDPVDKFGDHERILARVLVRGAPAGFGHPRWWVLGEEARS